MSGRIGIEIHVTIETETETETEAGTGTILATETDMIPETGPAITTRATETETETETGTTTGYVTTTHVRETGTTTGHVTTTAVAVTAVITVTDMTESEGDMIRAIRVRPEMSGSHVSGRYHPLASQSRTIPLPLLPVSRSGLRSEEDGRLLLRELLNIVQRWRSGRHERRLLLSKGIRWATLWFETITTRLLSEVLLLVSLRLLSSCETSTTSSSLF